MLMTVQKLSSVEFFHSTRRNERDNPRERDSLSEWWRHDLRFMHVQILARAEEKRIVGGINEFFALERNNC